MLTLRYLVLLISTLFLIGHASAQLSQVPPLEENASSVESQPCGDAITTTCLVEEIRSFLASDIDPFKRERGTLALAQAQLADGNVRDALASYEQLEAKTARAEFLVSYAKHLIADGDKEDALERLREADSLLTDGEGDLERLNATRQSQLIAETFAQAGANEEGRVILDGIASYRNRIPLNPMLLALMLQVSETQAGIGFRKEAATVVEETYELALDQGMEVMPELVLNIFETWAALDAASATTAAEDLAAIVGEDGGSAFEFAIWVGLSSGVAASDDDNAVFLRRAQTSLDAAPERGAALVFVPKLADVLKQAGKIEQARVLLERAHTEAATLASPMEKAPLLLALAEGFAGVEAPEEAAGILNELLAMPREAGPEGMVLRHLASAIPAQLALLGRIDEAYDLALDADGGSREMSLVMAADKLATQGHYLEAMRFLHEVEGEIAVMMMAGIADRLVDTSDR